jgi:tRNA (adenine37-N6)-methyltransferase
MTDMITCTPIGVVRNAVTKMSQGNWAEVQSEIHIDTQYAGGLQGLEEFSHVMVVFCLDQATGFDPAKQLLRHPRGMKNLRQVGVFAQRTKFRPNPIAVTSVAIEGIAGNVVTVRALDALDGTPVLDLKPYVPMFDRIEHPRTPDWLVHFMEGYL